MCISNHEGRTKLCFLANGNSVHTRRWIEYFTNRDYEVHLITFHGSDSVSNLDNLIIHNLYRRTFKFINFVYYILISKVIISKIKPDLVHAHYVTHYGVAAFFLGVHPFILTAWGSDILIDPKQNPMVGYLVKRVLNKADVITCDADHMLKVINKYCGDKEKTQLIFFGTDLTKFRRHDVGVVSDHILLQKKDLTVISLRGLNKIYDIETLIKSIPFVKEKHPFVHFLIGGEGPEKENLMAMVSSNNLSNNVTFLGMLPNSELPEYLSISDVYISTSLSDAGLSASTAEAMACQLPVLITDFGDNGLWVKNNINGFLFSCGDYEQLANKLIYLLDNQQERIKMGDNNRKLIDKQLNYHKEMSKVEHIYRSNWRKK